MNAPIGVLIFPAGEINSVELCDALSYSVNVRLYGASSVDRHGEFVFKNYISGVPKITEPGFIDALNRLIAENSIDVIMSTHDDVALFLAENKEGINAKVLPCSKETAEVCRDKQKTYEMFADCIFCPKLYKNIGCFPLFIKPRKGQGSVGAKLLTRLSEAPVDMDLNEYVLTEYLPGEEWTVDCFTDQDRCLRAVLPRSRQRVFGGVSVRSANEHLTGEIQSIAETINLRLSFLGLWYFQIKRDKHGRFRLLEISARCAGAMCASRALGVNLPLLSVYAAMGRKTEIMANDYDVTVDRTLISRYKTDLKYDRVYMDFDDTIIIHDKVNLQAMRFIYQCVNSRKHIVLITRHGEDHDDTLLEALGRHKIARNLFDEIIELGFDTPKHAAINSEGAIFIDNSFAERKAVRDNLRIPVFDADGIEVLLDWRV